MIDDRGLKVGKKDGDVRIDALEKEVKELRERVNVFESILVSHGMMKFTNRKLLGMNGLEMRYGDLFLQIDSDGKEVARFFFRVMSYVERVDVLLRYGVISGYISDDPMYYLNALKVMRQDASKGFQVFSSIRSRMVGRYSRK